VASSRLVRRDPSCSPGLNGCPGSIGLDGHTRKFNGKEFDQESELYDFGARFYDPVSARFLTADDRIPGGGTNPQAFNRFAYVFNDPVRYTDPSGNQPLSLLDEELTCDLCQDNLPVFLTRYNDSGSLDAGWVGPRDQYAFFDTLTFEVKGTYQASALFTTIQQTNRRAIIDVGPFRFEKALRNDDYGFELRPGRTRFGALFREGDAGTAKFEYVLFQTSRARLAGTGPALENVRVGGQLALDTDRAAGITYIDVRLYLKGEGSIRTPKNDPSLTGVVFAA
jgi:RHS repeat-associated protein